MPPLPNDPNALSQVVEGFNSATFGTAVFMAAWGCVVNYAYRITRGKAKFSICELLIEMLMSTFAGVTVFILSVGLLHATPVVAAAFAGLAGHAGARTIILLLRVMFKRGGDLLKQED